MAGSRSLLGRLAAPGPGRGAALLGALLVATAVGRSACAPVDTGGDDEAVAAVLAALADDVVLPGLRDFAVQADALQLAVGDWNDAQAVATGDDGGEVAAARSDARDAWRAAMTSWQHLEPMQVGPAAASLSSSAGEDRRDRIYSWPTVNPCRIDQELVAEGYADPGFFSASLVNVLGLDALEHLLFHEDADNTCPGQVDINESGSWDALGLQEVQRRRAAYAAAVAAELAEQAAQLADAWEPAGADFGSLLSRADADASPYDSTLEALDAVYSALFYLDLVAKDRKLARPLGLLDCGTELCPDDLESLLSSHGLLNLRANVAGFRALLLGGAGVGGGDGDEDADGDGDATGPGFDDLLIARDRADLVPPMVNGLIAADDALDALDALNSAPVDILLSDPAPLVALHDALKQVTDVLKGEFATVLLLQVPSEAAGDND